MNADSMKDMTSGSPGKLILAFFVPMVFGLLFQQMYNMVDTIIVGKYLGVHALAAVGSTGSINFMIIGFCMGVCNGFAIPVAQKFGERNFSQLRRFVANGAWLAVIFAVVMTLVVTVLCRQILQWMNTPADIIDGAYDYIVIIFIGIPATYLYNMTSGIIRSMGDSRTPLVFLVMSSIINVFLDLFFIVEMGVGVAGAAWATVIAQAVSGICCLIYMRKKYEILKMTKEEKAIDRNTMIVLCNMGIPMGLQYSITAIGSVLLQTSVNGLGSMAVAAVTAGSKISMFFCCPFDALGATMATYGGQNIGAGRLDRIRQGVKVAMLLGAVYAVIALVILVTTGEQITLLFMDRDQEAILNDVQQFLILNTVFFLPLAALNILRFLIQGMGYSKLAVLAGVSEMAARSLVAFCLVPFFGYLAVCMANPAAWIAADLFLIPAYIYVMKKLSAKMKYRQELDSGTNSSEAV